jgi:hypothetical protein
LVTIVEGQLVVDAGVDVAEAVEDEARACCR